MYKVVKDRMAQNVKDAQIDRILKFAKEHGVCMRYLCELVGKKRNFLALVALGKDYVDENELTIIAARLETGFPQGTRDFCYESLECSI